MVNNMNNNLKENLFFCYNKKLKQYLYFECGIDSEFSALHPKTMKEFWVYVKTEELDKALTGYRK
ncbi:hypothetical protein [Lactococcus lactis]|nr:hypothetical protein [Lactococcus lactis]MCG6979064.1 hypothetical protein [Lactococcus lactis]WBM78280.1 hypothetical protein OHI04_04460 [Lactococcus lactis]WOF39430.1 hypothetical protein N4R43_07220 [Lactococcus lactis]WSP32730.1 hypothetical protein VVB72_04455 [Lactococcus lactis subsp. lactis]